VTQAFTAQRPALAPQRVCATLVTTALELHKLLAPLQLADQFAQPVATVSRALPLPNTVKAGFITWTLVKRPSLTVQSAHQAPIVRARLWLQLEHLVMTDTTVKPVLQYRINTPLLQATSRT
jgi:hypothetical protein